jgi:hypothetical protein
MLFQAHSGLRYLVLAAAVVALVLLAMGAFGSRPISRGARVSGAIFTGLLDLQVLLGLGTLLARPWYPALMGHITMMVLALVAAHGFRVAARRAPTDARRGTFALLAVAVPLVLVVGGILAIGRPLL